MLERLTALPGQIIHPRDVWWSVGQIIDAIAGIKLVVECKLPRLRLGA